MATAVLVHGAWSNPADWRWVAACLHARGVQAAIPDLPSHRHRSANRSDDVREVEAAIRAGTPPVVVVGWSYGGDVISDLADINLVDRLLYLSSLPLPPHVNSGQEPFDPLGLPHLLFPDETTVVLDDDWWLNSEEVAAFPDEVIRHLREHRRRPITKSAWLAPPAAEAWRTIPISILLGRSDWLIPAREVEWAHTQFDDVRIVEGNHFLPFLRPDLVAEVIAETLAAH